MSKKGVMGKNSLFCDSINQIIHSLIGLRDAIQSCMKTLKEKIKFVKDDVEGRVLPPLILYMLGVPGIIVIVLWFFIWRGK